MSQTKDLEHQLRLSRESLDFALKSARMGTWEIDLKHNIVICSQEMLDLWGIDAQTFDGNRPILQSRVHPDDRAKMTEAISFAISNDAIYELEYRICPRPGVERWVLSRGRCSYDQDSQDPVRFSGVVLDITERKMKEEALEVALKARDQFYMIAGHELKTPLTCLHLQLKVNQWELRYNYPDAFSDKKVELMLEKQNQQLLRLTRIIDNMLDEAQISKGQLPLHYESFDLCELVNQVVENFRFIALTSEVEFTYHPPVEKLHGSWDRFRLEQVLLNLLMNALRYGEQKPVSIEVFKENHHYCITVRDQGIGIKQEDQARIFNRFERGDSTQGIRGLGLGLFISNNIVRAHGGEIQLKSEPGKGSEFKIILPEQN